MEGVGLTSSAAFFIFVISLHIFYHSIDAQSHSTPSSCMVSPSKQILRVGVPWNPSSNEFISVAIDGTNIHVGGFCAEVFEAAIKTLNYSIHYIPFQYPSNFDRSSYDYIISQIVVKNLDAAVGDFTITSNRLKEVQFAQPFLDSGLVAVVRLKEEAIISFGWAFTKPFTAEMWLLIVGFFISGGMVVYILEGKNNLRFQGQPGKHFGNILWFSFSTWFTNLDEIRTAMGRIVVVTCLFVLGILQSCYTANLSAILTAPRLEPTLNDFSGIAASNLRIGYHEKSTVSDFLIENYGISKHRLVPLRMPSYYNALSRGDVGAIIDERPYMQSLVAQHCSRFAFAGQTFTNLNWGFAFNLMDYQLARDISIRILELSENGKVDRLRKQWLPSYDSDCSSKYSIQSGTSQLQVQYFWGLFVISGLISVTVLLFYTVQKKLSSSRVASATDPPPPEGSSGPVPPNEGSSGHGRGGYISGSLELTKKNQFLRRTKSFDIAMPFVVI